MAVKAGVLLKVQVTPTGGSARVITCKSVNPSGIKDRIGEGRGTGDLAPVPYWMGIEGKFSAECNDYDDAMWLVNNRSYGPNGSASGKVVTFNVLDMSNAEGAITSGSFVGMLHTPMFPSWGEGDEAKMAFDIECTVIPASMLPAGVS